MRRRTRLLLILELVLGVVPLTFLYVYFFPAGVFWVRSVLTQAAHGTTNLFTAGFAVLHLGGGLALVALWATMIRRLAGRGGPGRLLKSGLVVGIGASVAALAILTVIGAFWLDWYLYGTPLLVASHQLIAARRAAPAGTP